MRQRNTAPRDGAPWDLWLVRRVPQQHIGKASVRRPRAGSCPDPGQIRRSATDASQGSNLAAGSPSSSGPLSRAVLFCDAGHRLKQPLQPSIHQGRQARPGTFHREPAAVGARRGRYRAHGFAVSQGAAYNSTAQMPSGAPSVVNQRVDWSGADRYKTGRRQSVRSEGRLTVAPQRHSAQDSDPLPFTRWRRQ